MRFTIRALPGLFWRALDKFFADGCSVLAAAISFYTFFSLPALLALLLGLVGTFTDPAAVQRAIVTQVQGLTGPGAAEQIRVIITRAAFTGADASVAAALGGLAVLFGATTAFASLQNALNKAWNVKPDPRRGNIRNFLAKRIFSFGVVLVVAFLLLVSLSLTAILSTIGGTITARLGLPTGVVATFEGLVSFAAVATLFAAMFKLLPDALIAWRDVWVGAVATALLFDLGKQLIGYYLGRTDPGSAYGAAGSLAIILIWVYYSSLLVLYGAELTRAWADSFGRGVTPQKGAIEVVEQEKTVQRG